MTVHKGVESSWNVMAHGDARGGKWRGNWRMEWVASTLHTTSEHGVSSIINADAHTSAGSSRLNWRPRRFKWTRPFRRKTKSGFCVCAITFQTYSSTAKSETLWIQFLLLRNHHTSITKTVKNVYRNNLHKNNCKLWAECRCWYWLRNLQLTLAVCAG
jgi:hypothetical protein